MNRGFHWRKAIGVLAGICLMLPGAQGVLQAAGPATPTHSVLCEYGTATWCGYCKYGHHALKQIWQDGAYDFYYVSLVDDKDTHASARVSEYNIYGFPTAYFDGGYITDVGAYTNYSQQQSWYETTITQCGNRAVPDIVTTVTAEWSGDATMLITASVQNNEATQYDGHIRVYVTENESSLGWNDTAGDPYTFPLLDYAFNQGISIAAGGTWNGSITWDGHGYDDGHGHDFGKITPNNIMVIAGVFNSQWHQGYSNPPNGYPFDAYYVDDATGVVPTISELIVDDSHDQFSVYAGGAWSSISYPDAENGSTHYIQAGTGSNIVAWQVDQIITPGTYDVYVWKFDHPWSSQMATNAPFIIKDKNGIAGIVQVDQSTVGDEWVYLGSYQFDNSSSQGLGVTDNADGIVAADAIKFVYTGP